MQHRSRQIPRRLERALDGLLKAGIMDERQLELLIARTVSQASGEKPAADWVDLLWDRVTELRARAEVERARSQKRSGAARGRAGKTGRKP